MPRTSSYGKVMFSTVSICLSVHRDSTLYRHIHQFLTIFSARQRNSGKVICQSCLSVCLFTGGSHVTITHDALDLIRHGPCTPPKKKSVQGPPHPPPACPNLFIMKDVWLKSGQLVSYWNAFLFSCVLKTAKSCNVYAKKGEVCN